MLRVHAETPTAAHRVKLPILVQQAGDDRLASVESTRRIFAALGSEDRQYIEYPGMYHEIWFEQERARTVGDLLEWLDKHT
jgi:alpha-beta hydrolase superfamily lysophospholipase